VPTSFPRRLVVGAAPCDAAALSLVDRIMGWDVVDELWSGRRRATTVIGLACPGVNRSCCCDRVGLGPDTSSGSDLFLHPDGDGFRVGVVSERGRDLLAAHREPEVGLAEAPLEPAPAPCPPAALPGLVEWLDANFDHPIWSELALPCHGCGVCAAVCPTCHCFDIVDEPEGVARGVRRRNWDTCQSAHFTVHASGHNPRPDQTARLRQRIRHKFAIYPRRFRAILCTGCGRCARACPAGIDLPEILDRLSQCVAGSGDAATVSS
jgi:ferredoxin